MSKLFKIFQKKNIYIFLWVSLPFVTACKAQDNNLKNNTFPSVKESFKDFPEKEKVWVFIMAGQSNMAGRGVVEPQDTIPVKGVISLDNKNNWLIAKEPLHLYQPELTGLDSGLSFGKTLKNNIPNDVVIALVPCAVGGSSIEDWSNDSIFKGIRLKSNFEERVKEAKKIGVIKGILWHQGEANAFENRTEGYREKLEALFAYFRRFIENDELPIFVGELGSYPVKDDIRLNCHKINYDIIQITESDKNTYLIHTEDLTFKEDHVHFDSKSQRILGERYAQKFLNIVQQKNK